MEDGFVITGRVVGDAFGNAVADADVLGDVGGGMLSNVADVLGNFVGDMLGNVVANVLGDVADVLGNFVGDMLGNVFANVIGEFVRSLPGVVLSK